jgi:hypothetical protein
VNTRRRARRKRSSSGVDESRVVVQPRLGLRSARGRTAVAGPAALRPAGAGEREVEAYLELVAPETRLHTLTRIGSGEGVIRGDEEARAFGDHADALREAGLEEVNRRHPLAPGASRQHVKGWDQTDPGTGRWC